MLGRCVKPTSTVPADDELYVIKSIVALKAAHFMLGSSSEMNVSLQLAELRK